MNAQSMQRAFAVVVMTGGVLCAQNTPDTIQIPPPPKAEGYERVKIEKPKLVLNDQGHVLEGAVTFPLIGRESVNVEVTLGEAGEFKMELAGKAALKIQEQHRENGVARAVIVRTVTPMSGQELLEQRDEALRPLQGKAGALRSKLNEAAAAHPQRFSNQEKKSWEAMSADDLIKFYAKVLQTKIAEEHLQRCGLDFDRSTRDAAEKVVPMFLALHAWMTGDDSPEGKRAREGVSGGAAATVHQALTVDLRLQSHSQADSKDANAQWFNAQRVACRTSGAASIRVEGALDPARGDNADWWTIDRWEPGSIEYMTSDGVQFDAPLIVADVAHVRVRATKAATYWFEMRAVRGGEHKIIVHESHNPPTLKFPY